MKYAYLFLSVAFNVASYFLYKSISNREGGLFWTAVFVSGLILGGINVLFFTKALKNIPLSVAYPVFSGACIFAMSLLSYVFFGEKISALNAAGAVVVVIGIAMLTN